MEGFKTASNFSNDSTGWILTGGWVDVGFIGVEVRGESAMRSLAMLSSCRKCWAKHSQGTRSLTRHFLAEVTGDGVLDFPVGGRSNMTVTSCIVTIDFTLGSMEGSGVSCLGEVSFDLIPAGAS